MKAVTAWLVLVDAGKYHLCWDGAAKLIKRLGRDQFPSMLKQTARTVGKKQKRTLKSAELKLNIRGMPPGKYLVIHYETDFENKKNGAEKVTAVFEDNAWKIAGYRVE